MKKEKRKMMFTLLILLFLGLGIGYAALATNLSINGTSTMIASSWDIHFENLNVVDGSVDIGTGDSAATITSPTAITYTVTLAQPGDFYDFTVDVKNDGTIDGMIGNISYKVNGSSTEYLNRPFVFDIKYTDGTLLDLNQQLLAGEKETLKVHIGYSTNINASDLPSTDTTKTITVEITYVQADENAFSPHPDFATDPWDKIAHHPNGYPVGSTREITIPSLGTYTLRIVNNSSPNECNDPEFSQTACGLVIEFVEIVERRTMHSTSVQNGWPSTDLRTYLNTDFYNLLPDDLKSRILPTNVVTGCNNITGGRTDIYTSEDYIYLLDPREYGSTGNYMTNYSRTRSLDYYDGSQSNNKINPVTNMEGRYWIRFEGQTTGHFYEKTSDGNGYLTGTNPTTLSGVSPAFRIGLSE